MYICIYVYVCVCVCVCVCVRVCVYVCIYICIYIYYYSYIRLRDSRRVSGVAVVWCGQNTKPTHTTCEHSFSQTTDKRI